MPRPTVRSEHGDQPDGEDREFDARDEAHAGMVGPGVDRPARRDGLPEPLLRAGLLRGARPAGRLLRRRPVVRLAIASSSRSAGIGGGEFDGAPELVRMRAATVGPTVAAPITPRRQREREDDRSASVRFPVMASLLSGRDRPGRRARRAPARPPLLPCERRLPPRPLVPLGPAVVPPILLEAGVIGAVEAHFPPSVSRPPPPPHRTTWTCGWSVLRCSTADPVQRHPLLLLEFAHAHGG